MCKQSQINRDKIIKFFIYILKLIYKMKNIWKLPKVRYLRTKKDLKKRYKNFKKSLFKAFFAFFKSIFYIFHKFQLKMNNFEFIFVNLSKNHNFYAIFLDFFAIFM